ncbi:MAG: sugar transferase [Pirellulales bacterium]|nr:sugar transferase [Pirellulales bacterium]
MIRLRHKLFIHGLRVFDQAALALSLFITVAIAKGVHSWPQIYIVFQREYKLIESLALILMFVAWTMVYNRFVQYDTNQFVRLLRQLWLHLKASTATAFLLLLAGALFDFETLGLHSIALFWALNITLGSVARIFIRITLLISSRSESSRRNILIVGTGKSAVELSRKALARSELGYQLCGYISANAEDAVADEVNVIGSLEDLPKLLEKEKIDEILIALSLQENLANVVKIIQYGRDLGVVVRFIPNTGLAQVIKNLHVETFEGSLIVTFFRESHVGQLFIKRVMDVVISGFMLLLLTPLFLIVAIAIKLDSKGPIFFAQERVGMNKRAFKLLKFRSMVVNAEELREALTDQNEVDGPVFKIKKDPRITRVGRFIRKTSIDELPQLWNAFIGDISLVGPRPPLFSEVDQYEWLFRRRLSVKPGITCLWQVSGRNELSFDEWMELDKEYIETWSIWLDIAILLKTIPTVLLGRGAS